MVGNENWKNSRFVQQHGYAMGTIQALNISLFIDIAVGKGKASYFSILTSLNSCSLVIAY